MLKFIERRREHFGYRVISSFLLLSFFFTSVIPSSFAQILPELLLPTPGSMMARSETFVPTILRGITINPEKPFQFDFIVDRGNANLEGEELKAEATKLIKYFLASVTIPNKEMWVNLSPYEKDRIIPDSLGATDLGVDLLSQDYILKQLTASLIYPENDLGREFWNRVYKKAKDEFGTTDMPVNTFNKVWIMPDKAVVYEHNGSVLVVERHLKVMLEEDYLALTNNTVEKKIGIAQFNQDVKVVNKTASDVVRQVLIPEIEKEVNYGKNFAQLRQIYNSMILATWYKQSLKESLLGQVYADKNKITGVDIENKKTKLKIYDQYLEAFKKGVYNYIKEEYDPQSEEIVSRKYFSGGAVGVQTVERKDQFSDLTNSQQEEAKARKENEVVATTNMVVENKDEGSERGDAKTNIGDKNILTDVIKRTFFAVFLAGALCGGSGCSSGDSSSKAGQSDSMEYAEMDKNALSFITKELIAQINFLINSKGDPSAGFTEYDDIYGKVQVAASREVIAYLISYAQQRSNESDKRSAAIRLIGKFALSSYDIEYERAIHFLHTVKNDTTGLYEEGNVIAALDAEQEIKLRRSAISSGTVEHPGTIINDFKPPQTPVLKPIEPKKEIPKKIITVRNPASGGAFVLMYTIVRIDTVLFPLSNKGGVSIRVEKAGKSKGKKKKEDYKIEYKILSPTEMILKRLMDNRDTANGMLKPEKNSASEATAIFWDDDFDIDENWGVIKPIRSEVYKKIYEKLVKFTSFSESWKVIGTTPFKEIIQTARGGDEAQKDVRKAIIQHIRNASREHQSTIYDFNLLEQIQFSSENEKLILRFLNEILNDETREFAPATKKAAKVLKDKLENPEEILRDTIPPVGNVNDTLDAATSQAIEGLLLWYEGASEHNLLNLRDNSEDDTIPTFNPAILKAVTTELSSLKSIRSLETASKSQAFKNILKLSQKDPFRVAGALNLYSGNSDLNPLNLRIYALSLLKLIDYTTYESYFHAYDFLSFIIQKEFPEFKVVDKNLGTSLLTTASEVRKDLMQKYPEFEQQRLGKSQNQQPDKKVQPLQDNKTPLQYKSKMDPEIYRQVKERLDSLQDIRSWEKATSSDLYLHIIFTLSLKDGLSVIEAAIAYAEDEANPSNSRLLAINLLEHADIPIYKAYLRIYNFLSLVSSGTDLRFSDEQKREAPRVLKNIQTMYPDFEDLRREAEEYYQNKFIPDQNEEKSPDPVGGINLDADQLDLQIRRDGKGMPLPVQQQPILNMRIDGFVPVIINISPANVPLLLGIADEEEKNNELSFNLSSVQPKDRKDKFRFN